MPDSTNFAPRSFFFTDPAAISQSETQAFGPVDENQFRTTAKFSVTADTPAYAVCKGVVLVQPQATDSTRVNLILRPFKQPIQGLNIQYFVYRGLDVSDFFSNGDVLPATETTSGFINSINAAFKAYYNHISPGAALPEFKASFIGYDPEHQPATTLLSDLFFKQSAITGEGVNTQEQSPFELPLVDEGTSLGNFKAGECGFEVVLSYGDYRLPDPNDEFRFDLAYARAVENIIDLVTETEEFKKKIIREQISQFLDVAAYFGFHAIDTGSVILSNSAARLIKKGQEIYDLMVSKFFTKNRLYLYIQSERTRSYNFYGNYSIAANNDNCLKIGISEASLTARKYETSGWPLIIDESGQSHNENIVYIQLVTDNNVNTVLYGQVAHIADTGNKNFCGPDDLRNLEESSAQRTFTKPLSVVNPAVTVNSSKLTISTFNIIVFQGVVYNYNAGPDTDENTTETIFKPANNMDDLFDLINAEPLIKSSSDTEQYVLSSTRIQLVNFYKNGLQLGVAAIQTIVVMDRLKSNDSNNTLSRVSYISEVVGILNEASDTSGKVIINTSISSAGSIPTDGTVYTLPYPYYYDISLFTDGDSTITGLQLKTQDGTLPSKIILGITQTENDLLRSVILNNESRNPRIFFEQSYLNDVDQISTEGNSFQTYIIGVSDEFNGQPRHLRTVPEVLVYSLDGLCYFSSGFSDQIAMSVNEIVEKIYTL